MTLHDVVMLDSIRALLGSNTSNAEIVRHALFILMQAESLNRCSKLGFHDPTTGITEPFLLASMPLTGSLHAPAAGALQVSLATGLAEHVNKLLEKQGKPTTAIVRYALEFCKLVLKRRREGWSFGVITEYGFEPLLDVLALMGGNSRVARKDNRKATPQTDIIMKPFDNDELSVIDVLDQLTSSFVSLKGTSGGTKRVVGSGDAPLSRSDYESLFASFEQGLFVGMNAPFGLEDIPEVEEIAQEVQQKRLLGRLERSIYVYDREADSRKARSYFSRLISRSPNLEQAAIDKIVFMCGTEVLESHDMPLFFGRIGNHPVLIRYEGMKDNVPVRAVQYIGWSPEVRVSFLTLSRAISGGMRVGRIMPAVSGKHTTKHMGARD